MSAGLCDVSLLNAGFCDVQLPIMRRDEGKSSECAVLVSWRESKCAELWNERTREKGREEY